MKDWWLLVGIEFHRKNINSHYIILNIISRLFYENLVEALSKSLSHRLKVQRAKISNKAILFPFVQFAVFYNEIDLSLGWKFGTKFDLEVHQQNSFQLFPPPCISSWASSPLPELGCRSPTFHPNIHCWLPWYQMIYPSHPARGVQRWSIFNISPAPPTKT